MASKQLQSDALTTQHDIEKDKLRNLCIKANALVGGQKTKDHSLQEELSLRLSRVSLSGNQDQEAAQQNERVTFASQCLGLLVEIHSTLLSVITSGEKFVVSDRDHVGVRDLRLIHTLLQVVVSWGIYPCLLPGVGVPLSKRVKSGYTNHELLAEDEAETQKEPRETMRFLFTITTTLVDLVSRTQAVPESKNYTTVASIIMARHLPDMFAALLQLAYSPIPKKPSSPDTHQPKPTPTDPTQLFISQTSLPQQDERLSPEERNKCARMFMWLFERADVYRCMESLMLLLGTSPLHPVPNWLKSICGRFLSRILLRPKGVVTVIEFTLGDMDQVQLDQLERVAKLVLAIPQQMPSVESYYQVVAPQVVSILESAVKANQDQLPKVQAATFIMGRMIVQHTELSKSILVDKMIGPMVGYWNSTEYDTQEETENGLDRQVMTEDDLHTLLRMLHRVMVGGEPSHLVIHTFLSDAIPVLYHLYEAAVKSKSGMREVVADLLTTYFRIATVKEVIHDLKRTLLDKVDLSDGRVAYFASGPTGGMVMRWRRKPHLLGGNELPHDPNILVEFLDKVGNPELSGDFFVFLLNEYSSLQALSSNTDPRVMLLILNIIMGMLDKLGPAILGKPTQIIAFACNVISDHADRMTKPKASTSKSTSAGGIFANLGNIVNEEELEAIEDLNDSQYTVTDDIESLILATNLLRAVMHENDELDSQATQLMKSVLEPLKQLEKMQLDEVQESLHELVLAITSYLSAQQMAGKSDRKGDASLAKYREAMKALQDDLLPVRAHGIGILKEMVLAKDPLVSSKEGLNTVLDMLVHLIQDEDSYIYINAVKGLSALTDAHGNAIIAKLGAIYTDKNASLDTRLRIGEALLQTVQRSGDALSKYVHSLITPLETVLSSRDVDKHLRVSALSIIGMACQTCPSALSGQMYQLVEWVLNILDIEKAPEVRRAATVLIISLFRGWASQALYRYPADSLRRTYRTLSYIENTDPDELTRHQARVALSDLDVIMRQEIFKK